MLEGLERVDVSGLAPGKCQFQEVGFSVDWSVKSMQAVSQIFESEAVNDAVGIQELTTI